MQAHYVAEHARSDYYRLRDENRARYQARGQDSYVADAAFANYQVAQDCIDTEQMYGRWSTERLAAARASYQQVTRLMDELAGFLRTNRRRVPSPRVGR